MRSTMATPLSARFFTRRGVRLISYSPISHMKAGRKDASDIRETSSLVRAKDQVSTDLGGEAVVLHLESEQYYGLNEVGARIWALLEAPKTVKEIRDALVTEYHIEPERCECEVLALLRELAEEGLIEVSDDPAQ